jgi:hypothetical protein
MAPIIKGLIDFITTQLQLTVWDGEVPRYSTQSSGSVPIKPSTVATPPVWPVIKLYMEEGGFSRNWTFLDPYDDVGEIKICIWGITRESVETQMNAIEALLASVTNWGQIQLDGPPQNPHYIIQLLLMRWYSGQEEEIRTGLSQLLYRGDMYYLTQIHGAVSTR